VPIKVKVSHLGSQTQQALVGVVDIFNGTQEVGNMAHSLIGKLVLLKLEHKGFFQEPDDTPIVNDIETGIEDFLGDL
jgi:hypothetical protein